MAIPIKCPGCQAAFEVPDTLAGKTIRCTSCKTQLTVPALAAPAGEAGKKPFGYGSPAKAAPAAAALSLDDDPPKAKAAPPVAKAAPAAKPARPARADRDEDDDDDRPAKASPNGKAKPAAKRRDDDDEEDDDRPVKRGRKAAKGGAAGGMLLLIGGGVFGLIAIVGVVIFLVMNSGGDDKDKKDTASDSGSSTAAATSSAGPVPGGAPGMPGMPGGGPGMPGMPGAAAPGGGAGGGWEQISGDGYSASMPPGRKQTQTQSAGPGMTMKIHVVERANGSEAFLAASLSLPPGAGEELATNTAKRNLLLGEMAKGFEKGANGGGGGFGFGRRSIRVQSSSDITHDGFPGRELRIGDNTGRGGGTLRLVIGGGRVFVFGALGNDAGALASDAGTFISGFKITAGGGQVAMGPPGMGVPGMPGSLGPVPGVPGADPGMPGVPGADPGMPGSLGPVPGMPGATLPPTGIPGMPGSLGPIPGMPGATLPPNGIPGMPGATLPPNGIPGMPGSLGPVPGMPGTSIGPVPPMPGAAPGVPGSSIGPMPGAAPGVPGVPGQPPMFPGAGVPGMEQPGFGGLPGSELGQSAPPPPPGAETRPPLLAKVDPFLAVAFDPEAGDLFTVTHRRISGTKVGGTLCRYTYPDFKKRGEYKLPNCATRVVIDPKKGVLYLASSPTTMSQATLQQIFQSQFDRPVVTGDIQIIDLAPIRSGKVEERADVKPTAAISLVGLQQVVGLSLSADGKALYAVTTRSLGGRAKSYVKQLDTADRKQVKEKELPERAWAMRPAPDGKALLVIDWPKNNAAGVTVFDPAGWTVKKSMRMPGPTTDVAPTTDGKLVAAVSEANKPRDAKLFLIDPENGNPKDVDAPGWKAANNNYAAFTADAKYLFATSFGSVTRTGALQDRGLDVYKVSSLDDPSGLKKVSSIRSSGGTPVGGHFHVSPDGEYLMFQTGAVLAVDKLTEHVGGTDPEPPAGGGVPGFPGAAPPGAFQPGAVPPGVVPPGGIPGMPGAAPPGGMPVLPPGGMPVPPGAVPPRGIPGMPMAPGGVPGAVPPGGVPGAAPGMGMPGAVPPGGIPGAAPPAGVPGTVPPGGVPGTAPPGMVPGTVPPRQP